MKRPLYEIPSVMVPFQLIDGVQVKQDDLPRFLTPHAATIYLHLNGQRLAHRRLMWIECEEREFVNEYLMGVGTESPGRRH